MLELDNIQVQHHGKTIVEGISFTIEAGEIACLLGPSGCGKTTLLNAIAGFLEPRQGHILLEGNTLSKYQSVMAPEKRGIGMVFQDYALFPHLTVRKNIAFGVQHKQGKETLVESLIDQVGLQGMGQRYPHELSGGQQQRVALARSLAAKPKLLLLDEPFSNLDNDLRKKLGTELRDLLKQQGITTLLVTHDQHDAFALGDKTGVMSHGLLHQWDTAYNLYHEPATEFVAEFVGEGSFIDGHMIADKTVITEFGEIRGDTVTNALTGQDVKVLVRPDDVLVNAQAKLKLEVARKAFRGAYILYTLKIPNGETILTLLPSHENFEIGDQIGVSIDADHLVVFPAT